MNLSNTAFAEKLYCQVINNDTGKKITYISLNLINEEFIAPTNREGCLVFSGTF